MPSNTRQLVQKGAGPNGADIFVDPVSILKVAYDKQRQAHLTALHNQIASYKQNTQLIEGVFGWLRFLPEVTDIENHYAQLVANIHDYSNIHAFNHEQLAGALAMIGTYYAQTDGV